MAASPTTTLSLTSSTAASAGGTSNSSDTTTPYAHACGALTSQAETQTTLEAPPSSPPAPSGPLSSVPSPFAASHANAVRATPAVRASGAPLAQASRHAASCRRAAVRTAPAPTLRTRVLPASVLASAWTPASPMLVFPTRVSSAAIERSPSSTAEAKAEVQVAPPAVTCSWRAPPARARARARASHGGDGRSAAGDRLHRDARRGAAARAAPRRAAPAPRRRARALWRRSGPLPRKPLPHSTATSGALRGAPSVGLRERRRAGAAAMGGSDGSSSDGEAEGIGRAERARLKARRRAAREHAHAVRARSERTTRAPRVERRPPRADSAARDVQDALAGKPVPEGYVRTVRTTRGLEDGGCERERSSCGCLRTSTLAFAGARAAGAGAQMSACASRAARRRTCTPATPSQSTLPAASCAPPTAPSSAASSRVARGERCSGGWLRAHPRARGAHRAPRIDRLNGRQRRARSLE